MSLFLCTYVLQVRIGNELDHFFLSQFYKKPEKFRIRQVTEITIILYDVSYPACKVLLIQSESFLSFVPAVPLVMLLCSAAGAEESRIRHFSCDHVVPGSNLLPLVMAAGPSGIQLDFSYHHRGTNLTIGRPPPPPPRGARLQPAAPGDGCWPLGHSARLQLPAQGHHQHSRLDISTGAPPVTN
jgi:hypothetical protein